MKENRLKNTMEALAKKPGKAIDVAAIMREIQEDAKLSYPYANVETKTKNVAGALRIMKSEAAPFFEMGEKLPTHVEKGGALNVVKRMLLRIVRKSTKYMRVGQTIVNKQSAAVLADLYEAQHALLLTMIAENERISSDVRRLEKILLHMAMDRMPGSGDAREAFVSRSFEYMEIMKRCAPKPEGDIIIDIDSGMSERSILLIKNGYQRAYSVEPVAGGMVFLYQDKQTRIFTTPVEALRALEEESVQAITSSCVTFEKYPELVQAAFHILKPGGFFLLDETRRSIENCTEIRLAFTYKAEAAGFTLAEGSFLGFASVARKGMV